MDDMKAMSGECSVCHMQVADMMAHMKEMAERGDMAHNEAMDKHLMDEKGSM